MPVTSDTWFRLQLLCCSKLVLKRQDASCQLGKYLFVVCEPHRAVPKNGCFNRPHHVRTDLLRCTHDLLLLRRPRECTTQFYCFAADIWSLGLCVFELACGADLRRLTVLMPGCCRMLSSRAGVYPYGSVASFPVLFDNLCRRPAEFKRKPAATLR